MVPGDAMQQPQRPSDPASLTAAEAAAAIGDGRLTAETLARACLDRIAADDDRIRAFCWHDPERVIAAARAIDERPPIHALHGLCIAVKDMIDTHDMPTQHNSPIYEGHRPAKDAAVVAAVRALGSVIIGKTDTHEFAAGGRLPATTNPHDAAHTPGGSSSGSAAAVAAGMASLAFGTQTAGSMLRPASFCGIFGMKPTFGVVSREGAKHYSVSLDTIGWYGRSVADLGLLADGLRAIRRPLSLGRMRVADLRLAVYQTPGSDNAEPAAREAVQQAAARLSDAGAEVSELSLPSAFDALADVQNTIMRGEGRAAFLDDYLTSYPLLSRDFRDRVEDADDISFDRLRDALDQAARCRPEFDRHAGQFDAVVCIGAPGEAPKSLQTTGDSHFQRMWTALHVPAIAVPGFFGATGLPIGIQLVAPRYRDAELLETAETVAAILGIARVAPVVI